MTYNIDDFIWKTLPDGVSAELLGIKNPDALGRGAELEIPERFDGRPLRRIAEFAFKGTQGLASVEIPRSVREIGGCAFAYCFGLKRVGIQRDVERVGVGAFSGCVSLESFDLPDSLTRIGTRAFYNCASLATLTLPRGLVDVARCAFDKLTTLRVFADSVGERYAKDNGYRYALAR